VKFSDLKLENPLKEVSLKNVCMLFHIYKIGNRIYNKIFFNCKKMFYMVTYLRDMILIFNYINLYL